MVDERSDGAMERCWVWENGMPGAWRLGKVDCYSIAKGTRLSITLPN
jgi:hypothetical protein